MFDAVSLFNMSAQEMSELQEKDETKFQVIIPRFGPSPLPNFKYYYYYYGDYYYSYHYCYFVDFYYPFCHLLRTEGESKISATLLKRLYDLAVPSILILMYKKKRSKFNCLVFLIVL